MDPASARLCSSVGLNHPRSNPLSRQWKGLSFWVSNWSRQMDGFGRMGMWVVVLIGWVGRLGVESSSVERSQVEEGGGEGGLIDGEAEVGQALEHCHFVD